MSNSLDPDQAHFVGPDVCKKYQQMTSHRWWEKRYKLPQIRVIDEPSGPAVIFHLDLPVTSCQSLAIECML